MSPLHPSRNAHTLCGFVLMELLWSLIVLAVTLPGVALYLTNLTRTTKYLSDTHQTSLTTLKTFAVLSSALKAVERNRLECATVVTQGSSPLLPSGGRHPLSSLTGTSAPRPESDILTVIDLAPLYRGRIEAITALGSSIEARICGAARRPTSGQFKSYLLYTLAGPAQVVGDATSSGTGCYSVNGTLISGVVSQATWLAASAHEVAPIDREYSIFIDRSGNLRLASHTGSRILENQPITRGLRSLDITETELSGGIRSFALTITPSTGRSLQGTVVPGLSRRSIWNEVLP